MYANILPLYLLTKPFSRASVQLLSPLQHHHRHCHRHCHRHRLQQPRLISPICSTSSSTGGSSQGNNESDNPSPAPAPPTIKPPETAEIRFRQVSRRQRQRRQDQERMINDLPKREMPPPTKKWEEMTLTEKAVELYVGEKGLLFWLNKFAYASIFVVIGGWILFRFVGPSLNLYQLDSPPLPPTSMFKGS